MTVTGPAAPLDALGPLVGGRYEDDLVVVSAAGGQAPAGGAPVTRSTHFERWWEDHRLHLDHCLGGDQIDNDIAGLLATEVFASAPPGGSDTFERLFTGVVVTAGADPDSAWERFYRNTLRRLEAGPDATGAALGSLARFAPVHRHALGLVGPGSVLDVGCCFGFLSLQLAVAGRTVVASDLCPRSVELLALMAPRLGRDVLPLVCDGARISLPDRSIDDVVAVHLLEHLDRATGQAVVDEAARIARRRVVVAIPYENEPTSVFGHVRTLDATDLVSLARHAIPSSGGRWSVDVHPCHGGWLVMERTP